jgi:hypothetical protein
MRSPPPGLLTALLAVLSSPACQEQERAPLADVACEDPARCPGNPKGSGSGGTGGAGGGGGGADAVTVTGSISVLASDDLVTTVPLGDAATVTLEGSSGSPIEATYDGKSFALAGVRSAAEIWATIDPGPPALFTLQPVDTRGPDPLELLLVPRPVLELIGSVLTLPTAPAEGRAQIVLRLVDAETGKPRAGVRLAHPSAESIVYDAAGSYSDSVDASGPRGIALLWNLEAFPEPAKQKVSFDTGNSTGAAELLLRADGVTIATLGLPP